MSAKIDVLTFEGGLVDDLVEPRVTAVNHGRGCRQAENFVLLPQGPATTRPPSRYVARTKGDGAARLLRVIYSESLAYLVEFTDGYCRFYTNDGQIQSAGAAYTIASPYTAAQAAALQVVNDAGTVYLFHPDVAPYRLVYSAESSWTLEALPITGGPYCDENKTIATTVAADGLTGDVTLTASAAMFVTGDSGHVGAKWRIRHRVSEASLVHTFNGVATSTTLSVPKGTTWELTTGSTWDGTLILERSYDSGSTYQAITVWSPASDNNYTRTGREDYADALYRMRVSAWTSGTKCKAVLTVGYHIHTGTVTITAVASTTSASATVVDALASTDATELWSEGAWSPYRGYPRAGGLIDNRLAAGGTTADPTTIWVSRTNSYCDFLAVAGLAAASMRLTFTVQRGDPFLWIQGEQYKFYIGTPAAILECQCADARAAITPTNLPDIARRIEFGAAAVAPVRAHSTMIVMDPAATRPMEVRYDWESDLLVAPDLAFWCPTITGGGIRRVVFQRGRVPIVWFLRTDGTLLGLTYEQRWKEGIVAWHRHTTEGTIEDMAVLPSDDGDRLWWVVARTIDGATQRHVERLDLLDLEPERATAHALDAYVPFTGAGPTTITDISIGAAPDYTVTVTAADHGLTDGDNVAFAGVGGMTWLNGQVLVVANAATDTFTLTTLSGIGVDGSYLEPWTAGGTCRQVEDTFDGLGHLEGRTDVYAVCDGAVVGPLTVTGGQTSVGRWGRVVVAGLLAEATLQPLRIVLPLRDGSTRGRQMGVAGVWLSVSKSWSCEIGPSEAALQALDFWTPETTVDAVPALVTGDFFQRFEGNVSDDPTLIIRRSGALPLTVRALMIETTIGGSRSGKP